MEIFTKAKKIREWGQPPAFQIESGDVADIWTRMMDMMLSLADVRTEPLPEDKSPKANEPTATFDPGLAVVMANDLMRIRQNVVQMETEGRESKETRSIKRAASKLEEALQARGVECRDLTDQDYDFGRTDFEQIGAAVETEGLIRMKIVRCERPVVVVNGLLVQKARGLVARPPA